MVLAIELGCLNDAFGIVRIPLGQENSHLLGQISRSGGLGNPLLPKLATWRKLVTRSLATSSRLLFEMGQDKSLPTYLDLYVVSGSIGDPVKRNKDSVLTHVLDVSTGSNLNAVSNVLFCQFVAKISTIHVSVVVPVSVCVSVRR